MKKSIFLAQAELKSFWSSSAAGLCLLMFLVLEGFLFYNSVASYSVSNVKASIYGYNLNAEGMVFSEGLSSLSLVLILVVPLISMRCFSSAKKGGHFDLIQSFPLNNKEIVLGNFLFILTSLLILLVASIFPFIFLLFFKIGSLKILFSAYLGLFLLSCFFASLSLLLAALNTSSLSSALSTLGVLLVLWVLGWASPYFFIKNVGIFVQGLAFAPKISRFAYGLVNLNDVIFFLLASFLILLNSIYALNIRKHTGIN